MATPSLEQLFVTFRATRDPKPLAAIFDATAAELLLVAVHLVGDRAEAEDLVQATFVAVIEDADRYDASRPLRPWLVGVLCNRAKLALRRRRRTAAEDVTRHDVPARDAEPPELARAEETARHVARALEGLPSPYRQVLVLHLVHGLRGVQIAHALGRPPATVRTQLSRGLSMLREALPTLLVPAALLLAEGRGLAAVRVAILQQAGAASASAAGVAAGAAVAGGVVMGKKMLLLGVAVLSAGALLGFGQMDRGGSPRDPDTAAAVEPLGAALERATADTDLGTVALRESVELPPIGPARTVVRGRIVGAWDGAPQPADRIVITAHLADAYSVTRREQRKEWETAAGADGRFEVEVVFVAAHDWSLSVRGPEFTWTSGGIRLEGSGEHDLGDIAVRRGTLLRARVVDEAGAPMPDVPFEIERSFATLTGTTRGWSGVRSDAAGLLEHDRRLCEGEVELSARAGYTIVRGARFRIDEGTEVAEPTVVVRKLTDGESIAGRVEDPRGRGIPRIRINTGNRHRGFTRDDGTFRLFQEPGEGRSTTLDFVGTDAFVGRANESASFGGDDLRIVLDDAVAVPLRVVAADTGEPIEAFKLHFGGTDDPMLHRDDLAKHRRTGTHEDGRVELTGLPRTGRLVLIVHPEDDAHAMSPRITVDLPWGSSAPLEVRLPPREPVAVRVVDGGRKPVASARVELVQTNPGEDVTSSDFFFVTAEEAWLRLYPAIDTRWPAAFVIDDAMTGADGIAQLSCALPSTDVAVVVSGPGLRTSRVASVALGPEPIDVVVQGGAAVRGRVGPAAIVRRFWRTPREQGSADGIAIGLRRPGGPLIPAGANSDEHPIGSDGTFSIAGLEPGAWELVLLWNRPISAGSSQRMECGPPLRTIELAPGPALDVGELDLRPHAPATIRGRAFHQGTPVVHGTVTLERRSGDAATADEARLGDVATDADGRFAVGGLLPGSYTLHVEQVDAAGLRRTMQSEEVIVARGAELERVFELR